MHLQLTTTETAAPKAKAKCGAGAALNAGINAVVQCEAATWTVDGNAGPPDNVSAPRSEKQQDTRTLTWLSTHRHPSCYYT